MRNNYLSQREKSQTPGQWGRVRPGHGAGEGWSTCEGEGGSTCPCTINWALTVGSCARKRLPPLLARCQMEATATKENRAGHGPDSPDAVSSGSALLPWDKLNLLWHPYRVPGRSPSHTDGQHHAGVIWDPSSQRNTLEVVYEMNCARRYSSASTVPLSSNDLLAHPEIPGANT